MTTKKNIRSLYVTFLFICTVSVQADTISDRIESLIATGKLEQALALTDQQLSGDDSNINYLFLKGLILTRQNRMDDAQDIFSRLTKDHPELPEPFNNLAVIYAAQGDFTSARNALEQAINTHPSYATAHENLGDIYAKMASNAYNQALEIDSGNETAREKLSMISELFSTQGKKQESEDNTNQKMLVQKQEELNRLENDLADLTQRNKQLEKSAADLKVDLDRMKSQSDQAAVRSRREIEQAQEREARARQRMVQLEEELAHLESRLSTQLAAAEDTAVTTEQTSTEDVAAIKNDIIRTVDEWAAFWSNKDVEGYLSVYAEDYIPPAGLTRGEWTTQRRNRITMPRYIQVEIDNPRVDIMGPGHARVDFLQYYRSDRYRDRVKKTLLLKLDNGRWLIIEEKAG